MFYFLMSRCCRGDERILVIARRPRRRFRPSRSNQQFQRSLIWWPNIWEWRVLIYVTETRSSCYIRVCKFQLIKTWRFIRSSVHRLKHAKKERDTCTLQNCLQVCVRTYRTQTQSRIAAAATVNFPSLCLRFILQQIRNLFSIFFLFLMSERAHPTLFRASECARACVREHTCLSFSNVFPLVFPVLYFETSQKNNLFVLLHF